MLLEGSDGARMRQVDGEDSDDETEGVAEEEQELSMRDIMVGRRHMIIADPRHKCEG
jgi:hypothetical protein